MRHRQKGLRCAKGQAKHGVMGVLSTRVSLGLLFTAAMLLRLGYCGVTLGLGQPIPIHYSEYLIQGQRLLEQGTQVSPLIVDVPTTAPSALLPPAYGVLVAGVFAVFGTETFAATLALQVINALATSIAVVLVFLIARRIGGPRVAWVAALIAMFNPTLFGFTVHAWDTSLFCLGVTLAAWMSMRLSDTPSGRLVWPAFGFYLGALALLNPALTIAYPFLVLWPLTRSREWRFSALLAPVGLSILGWLIAITPWTIRNYVHFGELMYIRAGLLHELWIGSCPEADEDPSAVFPNQFPLQSAEAQDRIAAIGEQAYIKETGRKAIDAIAQDPWRFARLIAIRAVDYWAGTIFSHVRPGRSGWPSGVLRSAVAAFLLGEVLVIVLYLGIRRKLDRDLWWLLAIVLSFSIVYCITQTQVRFRAPTEPLMAIIVASIVLDIIGSRRPPGITPTAGQPDDPRTGI